MKKNLAKISRRVLGAICFACVILAGAEQADGGCDLVWTLSFLGASVLSGLAYRWIDTQIKKMEGVR